MPDLILMDINLPDISGLEATGHIKSAYPYVKIVMVTVSDDFIDLFEAIKHGVQGYLLKNVTNDSWITYLKAVVNDDATISNRLAEQMLQEFINHQKSKKNATGIYKPTRNLSIRRRFVVRTGRRNTYVGC